MKVVRVQIVGVTSLLQHRFTESAQAGTPTRATLVQRPLPREQAAEVAYKNSRGEFYFPGAAISRMLREAGGAHKMKGTRKSLKYIIPAGVLVMDDEVTIRADDDKPMKDFEIDSRPVTIPATKGRIMRHRPRFDGWRATLAIRVNEKVIPVETVHLLLTEGGEQIGIGDFRPEKGGPFGTFRIAWQYGATLQIFAASSLNSVTLGGAGRASARSGTPWQGQAWRGEARRPWYRKVPGPFYLSLPKSPDIDSATLW
jgi:hypothetical protein